MESLSRESEDLAARRVEIEAYRLKVEAYRLELEANRQQVSGLERQLAEEGEQVTAGRVRTNEALARLAAIAGSLAEAGAGFESTLTSLLNELRR